MVRSSPSSKASVDIPCISAARAPTSPVWPEPAMPCQVISATFPNVVGGTWLSDEPAARHRETRVAILDFTRERNAFNSALPLLCAAAIARRPAIRLWQTSARGPIELDALPRQRID